MMVNSRSSKINPSSTIKTDANSKNHTAALCSERIFDIRKILFDST